MKQLSLYVRCDGKQSLRHYENGTVHLLDGAGEILAIYHVISNGSLLQVMHAIIQEHLSDGLGLYRWELSSLEDYKLTYDNKYIIVEYSYMRNGCYSINYVLKHGQPIIFRTLNAADQWIGSHEGLYYVLDF